MELNRRGCEKRDQKEIKIEEQRKGKNTAGEIKKQRQSENTKERSTEMETIEKREADRFKGTKRKRCVCLGGGGRRVCKGIAGASQARLPRSAVC